MSANFNTPDSLRLPSQRSHHLRASGDFSAFQSPLSARSARPASEIFLASTSHRNASRAGAGGAMSPPPADDPESQAMDQWLQDLAHYESTLEEMAAASLDTNFKEELSAIEQWFRVLSEAERTAALYSLLNGTTSVQKRFLIQVLREMLRSDPMSQLLSPANYDKDVIQGQLSAAMSGLSIPSPSLASHPNRKSTALDASTVSNLFPDAAAAIAKERARLQNRRSVAFDHPQSPLWGTTGTPTSVRASEIIRPKSADLTGGWPTSASRLSASAQSPRVMSGSFVPDSPFGGPSGGSWASMVNTPLVPMFSQSTSSQSATTNANALREALAQQQQQVLQQHRQIILDSDVRKFRRGAKSPAPSTPGSNAGAYAGTPTSATNIVMYDEHGRLTALPQRAPTSPLLSGQRPRSPGLTSPLASAYPTTAGWTVPIGIQSPQANGFLAAFPPSSPILGLDAAGYLSDHSGRSVHRNGSQRRASSSKPQEDPTNPELLSDLSAWLRSLRLHKYTDNFTGLTWQDMVEMGDAELDAIGVNALGARRKLLKCFEQVREARDKGEL
ncbi:hypothetical protein SAICODRAFT_95498 [Saitoella complicata NRRL Y-17804]|nr:uncharacterized protein SAICODRAFT_95498 [Saitoella complicata NRRL Y-17804]ODQ51389.1 hypothetical protein SAICODRAFT_95498 [Saitoella complicata NRRL Y-17804]